MRSKVKTIRIDSTIPMPNGRYIGLWTGYTVVIPFDTNYYLTTVDGVRGIDEPCHVVIDNGLVTVESLDQSKYKVEIEYVRDTVARFKFEQGE